MMEEGTVNSLETEEGNVVSVENEAEGEGEVEENPIRDIKVVVVGDGGIGKTCVLIRYCEERFSQEYIPTVFDNRKKDVQYKGKEMSIGLWDTAGQEDYDRLRPLSYVDTDVFLIMFAIIDRDSFEHIIVKWNGEVNEYLGDRGKKILVGTKVDLRDDPEASKIIESRGIKPVTNEEGRKVCEEIGAFDYIETSAKGDINIDELFVRCCDCVFTKEEKEEEKKKRKCTIL